MRRYDGVLLDVDGTLVDSNDAHAHAWVEALAEFDIAVDYSRIRSLIGMGGDRVIELIGGLARDSRDNARIGERRSEIFRERWLHHVKPLTGTRELLLRLRAEQYQFVIATAARNDELTP